MKIICLILSIYTLYLVSLPCKDDIGCSDSNHPHSEQGTSHNDNDCHDCSPFCTCSCCHVSTIVTLQLFFAPVVFFFQKIETIHKESSLKEVFISIFQPPKL